MLPKANRVDKKAVEDVFRGGKFINSTLLTFKFFRQQTPTPPRVSFVAPKSVAKKAVDRNKLRRLGYRALEKSFSRIPAGVVGVFLFKKLSNTLLDIENDIEKIIDKLN